MSEEDPKEEPKEAVVHMYAQEQWHSDGWLVANREGLKALRKAIDKALTLKASVNSTAIEVFASDGEGYTLFVVRDDEDVRGMQVPYVDPIANAAVGVSPFDRIGGTRYRELVELARDEGREKK